MAHFSEADRTITMRVVYWGPPHAGKATNLQRIQEVLAPDGEAEVVSVESSGEEALLFQSPPIALEMDPPCWLVVHVCAATGDVHDPLTRRALLHDVDGVVFVADSQAARMDANIEAVTNLHENLKEQGYDLASMPYALQLNKRDLPSAVALAELEQALRVKDEPVFEAVATNGDGVFETLKSIIKLVLKDLKSR